MTAGGKPAVSEISVTGRAKETMLTEWLCGALSSGAVHEVGRTEKRGSGKTHIGIDKGRTWLTAVEIIRARGFVYKVAYM